MLEGRVRKKLDETLMVYRFLGRRKRERLVDTIAEYVPQDRLVTALDKAKVK